MGLKDDIIALIAARKNKPTDPPADPPTDPPADPKDQDPKAPDPKDPKDPVETFSKADVQKMLADQATETADAMAEMVKAFQGNGQPPIGGPAEPTETGGDFSAWNKEMKKIDKRNQRK